MTLYTPDIYIKNIDALNILSLCYKNLVLDIKKNIYKYLLIEASGFALFKNGDYGIYYNEGGGDPLEPLLKFISTYCRNTSCNIFNDILDRIYKTPNYKEIDLTECLLYLKKKDNTIFSKVLDFEELLHKINFNCINININLSITKYIYNNDYKFTEKLNSLCHYIIKPNNKNLYDLIIEKSNYNIVRINDNYHFVKYIFNYNEIINFEIDRLTMDDELDFSIIEIPKILDLPESVFSDNYKYVYNLIGVILIDNENGYSLIMKTGYNYYHHLLDKILLVNDEYFENFVYRHCIRLFYKKL